MKFFFLAVMFIFIFSNYSFGWWNNSFDRRIEVNLTSNSIPNSTYILKLRIPLEYINSTYLRENATDIRVVAGNDSTELPFFVDYVANGIERKNTTIYVKIPNTETKLYIYFNGTADTTKSNISIFDYLGEDCEGDLTGWTNTTTKQSFTKTASYTPLDFGTGNKYWCLADLSYNDNYHPLYKNLTERIISGLDHNVTIEYFTKPFWIENSFIVGLGYDFNACYNGLQTDWLPNSGQYPHIRYVHYGAGPTEINISHIVMDGNVPYKVTDVMNLKNGKKTDFAINITGNLFHEQFRLLSSSIRYSAADLTYFYFCFNKAGYVGYQVFDNIKIYKSYLSSRYPNITYSTEIRQTNCYYCNGRVLIIPYGCIYTTPLNTLLSICV